MVSVSPVHHHNSHLFASFTIISQIKLSINFFFNLLNFSKFSLLLVIYIEKYSLGKSQIILITSESSIYLGAFSSTSEDGLKVVSNQFESTIQHSTVLMNGKSTTAACTSMQKLH